MGYWGRFFGRGGIYICFGRMGSNGRMVILGVERFELRYGRVR